MPTRGDCRPSWSGVGGRRGRPAGRRFDRLCPPNRRLGTWRFGTLPGSGAGCGPPAGSTGLPTLDRGPPLDRADRAQHRRTRSPGWSGQSAADTLDSGARGAWCVRRGAGEPDRDPGRGGCRRSGGRSVTGCRLERNRGCAGSVRLRVLAAGCRGGGVAWAAVRGRTPSPGPAIMTTAVYILESTVDCWRQTPTPAHPLPP